MAAQNSNCNNGILENEKLHENDRHFKSVKGQVSEKLCHRLLCKSIDTVKFLIKVFDSL